jgi:hypothetical protein
MSIILAHDAATHGEEAKVLESDIGFLGSEFWLRKQHLMIRIIVPLFSRVEDQLHARRNTECVVGFRIITRKK